MFTSPKRSISYFTSSLFLIVLIVPINGFQSRKLDETGFSGSDPSIKCGGCSPCGYPCYQSPPPPPPPQLPPPPPKKPPATGYCPPPPYSPGFIYITGPPASLYPVDPTYSGSGRNLAADMKALMGCVLLGLFMLW